MVDLVTLEQILNASVDETIQLIELVLESLKSDLKKDSENTPKFKPFRVRQFILGQEVQVDRDLIYLVRGN